MTTTPPSNGLSVSGGSGVGGTGARTTVGLDARSS
jgi:hypothetical protein